MKYLLDTNVSLGACRSEETRTKFRQTFFPLLPATFLCGGVVYELFVNARDTRTRNLVREFTRPKERTGRIVIPIFEPTWWKERPYRETVLIQSADQVLPSLLLFFSVPFIKPRLEERRQFCVTISGRQRLVQQLQGLRVESESLALGLLGQALLQLWWEMESECHWSSPRMPWSRLPTFYWRSARDARMGSTVPLPRLGATERISSCPEGREAGEVSRLRHSLQGTDTLDDGMPFLGEPDHDGRPLASCSAHEPRRS